MTTLQQSPQVRTVLLFVDYYLPGFKGGGAVRSVANFVDDIRGKTKILIITRDRDLGDEQGYPRLTRRVWNRVGFADVAYVDWSSLRDLLWVAATVHQISPDLVYSNSYMSPFSGIFPLVCRRLRLIRAPILLAPRGELSDPALRIKSWKKRPYIGVARLLGLHRAVTFQASTSIEEKEISRQHPKNRILVSADRVRMPSRPNLSVPMQPLRLVHISRISPIKNLHRVIASLRYARGPISLEIWGPIEDGRYWHQCERAIGDLPANVRVIHRGMLDPDMVHDTLGTYHASVLCSLSENFGQAVAESLAAGCPVLVSKTLHWAPLVEGIAGWSVDPYNTEEIGRAICYMSETSDERWRELRQGCSTALETSRGKCAGLEGPDLITTALRRSRTAGRR